MPKNLPLLLFMGAGIACAQSITIPNNSFENGTLPLNIGLGPYSNVLAGSTIATGGALPNWTAAGTTANAAAGAYASTLSKWWDGNNIGYIYVFGPGAATLSQTLSATLQNKTTYTLSGLIGQVPTYLFNYAIQLWAGSTLLATSSALEAKASFVSATDTLTYFSGANNPQAGQPITIVIGATGTAQGYSGVFFDNISLTAATGATVAAVISAGAFGAFSSASPGSWIEIYGGNLAGDTRSWALSDFSGNNAPVSLDGTKVTIGGKAAFIDYISPGQVNALIPSDTPTGTQQLTLTGPAGASAVYSMTINPALPGLLAPPNFKIGNVQYAVAIFTDGAYALPAGAIQGVNSRSAKPGDVVTLYGVGFGPVTPSTPAGQLVQQLNSLSLPLLMNIGGIPRHALDYEPGLAPGYIRASTRSISRHTVPAPPGDAARSPLRSEERRERRRCICLSAIRRTTMDEQKKESGAAEHAIAGAAVGAAGVTTSVGLIGVSTAIATPALLAHHRCYRRPRMVGRQDTAHQGFVTCCRKRVQRGATCPAYG